jgi:hypothetical protein
MIYSHSVDTHVKMKGGHGPIENMFGAHALQRTRWA